MSTFRSSRTAAESEQILRERLAGLLHDEGFLVEPDPLLS